MYEVSYQLNNRVRAGGMYNENHQLFECAYREIVIY